MAKKKKIAGFADYIIPLGVVGLGVWGLYKLGIFGNSGSGLTPGSTPPVLANLFNGGTGAQPSNMMANASTNITAQTWLNNYSQTRGQDCFTGALFNSNPNGALLGPGDAQTLYHLIRSQAGTWFSAGDFTGIQAAFQNLCENQTDISEVGALFQTNTGQDLFQYITKASTFANGQNEAGNNMQLVQQFVQWATGLPQTGTEQ
jgi:hypothetical protein